LKRPASSALQLMSFLWLLERTRKDKLLGVLLICLFSGFETS